MIKSVFSAHLSEHDKRDLTLLINDRSFGSLTPESKSNFVLTSTRDVHMMTGFSNKSRYYDPRFNSDRIHLWNQAFKEMQASGLRAFPDFIRDHHIYAEYIYIFSADIFIGWQDRSKGLYLFRNDKIFRLQPTILPPNVFDDDWMQHADFYSFIPKTDDIVFSISDRIFERLDTNKAEDIMKENAQLSTSMSEIINLLRTYEQKLDLSWIGFEVARIEKNVFALDSRDNISYEENQERLSGKKRGFTRLINSSRVSRVRDGQRLIPAPKALKTSNKADARKRSLEEKHKESNSKYNIHNLENNTGNSRTERQKNIERLESQRPDSDIFWEDVRSFTFDPIINNLKTSVKNFFSLVPDKPIFSRIFATVIILIAIILFVLIGRAIGSRAENSVDTDIVESTAIVTRKITIDEEVVPPDSALLEIDITVKANNLQIRQEPRADAPIVATVQRGAKITQLSEPVDSWIFVRLADDETVGYAYADSLIN